VIELYTWPTPNGRKASIMLEEVGLPYTAFAVDIGKGQQFEPEFLALSPNNKIPAIRDTDDGTTLMESGAILMYLAEKAGMLLPRGRQAYWATVQWLMLQMGSVGPMLGQVHHFHRFHPGVSDYAEQRYLKEGARIYGVLDRRLAGHEYLAGSEYTIADVATWPWIARYEWQGVNWANFPNLLRWYRTIAARPAVQRGFAVPHATGPIPVP
jgi:GST-like protein